MDNPHDQSQLPVGAIEELLGQNTVYRVLSGGLVATTLLVRDSKGEYIFQLLDSRYSNQAKKKFYIYNLLENLQLGIPRAIRYGTFEDYSYLTTTRLDGVALSTVVNSISEASRKMVMERLGSDLKRIHSLSVGDYFGWLGSDVLSTYFENIESYLLSEVERIKQLIEPKLGIDKWTILEEILRNSISKISQSKRAPCLCWYDIQPANVLVTQDNDGFIFSGLLDPGAARLGLPEWDFAHAKVHLCLNNSEFETMSDSYGKELLDKVLIEAFIPIVICDDLALGYDRNWDFVINESLQRLRELLQYKF